MTSAEALHTGDVSDPLGSTVASSGTGHGVDASNAASFPLIRPETGKDRHQLRHTALPLALACSVRRWQEANNSFQDILKGYFKELDLVHCKF